MRKCWYLIKSVLRGKSLKKARKEWALVQLYEEDIRKKNNRLIIVEDGCEREADLMSFIKNFNININGSGNTVRLHQFEESVNNTIRIIGDDNTLEIDEGIIKIRNTLFHLEGEQLRIKIGKNHSRCDTYRILYRL